MPPRHSKRQDKAREYTNLVVYYLIHLNKFWPARILPTDQPGLHKRKGVKLHPYVIYVSHENNFPAVSRAQWKMLPLYCAWKNDLELKMS